MNNYQVTYHLVNGDKLSKNVQAFNVVILQKALMTTLDENIPVSINCNGSVMLLPANSILYFEIKEL